MKIVFDRPALSAIAAKCRPLTSGRKVLEQLACVRIVGEKGLATIHAHNGESCVSLSSAQVDVLKPGSTLVSCDGLNRALAACGEIPTVTIELDGDTLHVRGDRATAELNTLLVQDAPPLIEMGTTRTVDVPARELARSIDRTASMAEVTGQVTGQNYSIKGVLFKWDGTVVELAATDGKGLAVARVKGLAKAADSVRGIVPKTAIDLLRSMLPDGDQPVTIMFGENSIGAKWDGSEMRTLIVEGAFAPYADYVVKKDGTKLITFESKPLLEAVQRATLFLGPESRGVVFTPNGKAVGIRSRSDSTGRFNDTIPAEIEEGAYPFVSDPKFVVRAVEGCGTDAVRLELTGAGKMMSTRTDDGSFVMVWMPLDPKLAQ